MRPEDIKNNGRAGEGYGADGQMRSDYSERGSLPEYNDDSNEIIIGGSDDDADYDEYSRRLERRAAKPARRPKIEYEDDGRISRRERKRAFRKAREQEAAEAAAEAAEAAAAIAEEAADSGEIIIGASEAAGEEIERAENAAEAAVSQAADRASQQMQHIETISEEAAGVVHNAASHPTIERIEDSASAAAEDVIEIIEETAEDIKDAVSDKAGTVKEKAKEIREAIADKAEAVKEKAEDIREAIADKAEAVKEKAENIADAIVDPDDDFDYTDGSDILDDIVDTDDAADAVENAGRAAESVSRAERPRRAAPAKRIPDAARRVPSADVGEEISEQVAAIKEEISGKAAQFKETISETTVHAAAAGAAAAKAAGKRPSRVERIDHERDILDELLGDDTEYYSAPPEDNIQTSDDTAAAPETAEQPAAEASAETEDVPGEGAAAASVEDGPVEEEAVEAYTDEVPAEAYNEEEDSGVYADGEEDGETFADEDEDGEEYADEDEDSEAYDGEEEDGEAYTDEDEDGEAYTDEEEPAEETEEEYYGEDEYEEAGEPEIYDGSDEDEYDGSGLPLPVVKPRNLDAVRKRREASGEKSPAKVPRHDLLVSASPHIHCGETTRVLMGDVIIALIPALIASVLWFGWRALMITGVCVVTSVITEFICRRVMKRRQTVGDLSAVVTGMLLAFCLPPEINPVFAIIGSVVAIAVVKQMFGGIGMNFANPAATARIVMMLSFPAAMTTWSRPFYYYLDAISEATPLTKLAEGGGELPTYAELLVGYHSGCIGETCAVALLLGGAYLLLRGVISWEIPISFMGTVALFSLIVGQDPVYQLLSGGVILGAVFMATDYVTSPVNSKGRLIFGFGCGLFTMLIRLYGNMPEGVSFAILLMNILTPHIDRLTLPVPFGEEREAA